MSTLSSITNPTTSSLTSATSPTTSSTSSSSGSSSSGSLTTGTTSSNLGLIQIGGLASGLDTNSIITAMLGLDQEQITSLQNQQTAINAKDAAYKQVEANLLSLQSATEALDKTYNGVFDARTVNSSNQNVVTAAADSTASAGIYSVHVNTLAQAQQVVSQGFASQNASIGTGTVNLTVGGSTTPLNITASNNTLSGLASAINNANAGVSATVINNGGTTTPYQLLLTAAQTGTANAISVDTSGLSGGTAPNFGVGTVVNGTYTGTALPTASGTYNGSAATYTFTVKTGGTAGSSTSPPVVTWSDGAGNTGTLTLNTTNAVNVANNLQLNFGTATLNAGDTFTVNPTTNVVTKGTFTTGTGAATPTASGTYTGSSAAIYTFTVAAQGGTVGSNNLTVNWSDGNGNSGHLNIPSSYTAGTTLSVANGLNLSFGSGTLTAGDTFTVNATPPVQAAQNASVQLGSGSGAITVTNSSNTIGNLIPGVTLNLLASQATNDSNVTLTVTNDTSSAATAIQSFVTAYNAVIDNINSQSTYDTQTNTAGVLLGETQATNIENQLQSFAGALVTLPNKTQISLATLGITTSDTGDLQVNSTTLNNALSGQVSGVTLGDIKSLFTMTGSSTNPGITFLTATNQTNTSQSVQVNVSTPATQASLPSTSITAPIDISSANNNNTFQLSVDGVDSGMLTLASNNYSSVNDLAAALQTAINGASSLAGDQVTVGVNNGQLTITSNQYGSASGIAITGGTAVGSLGFASGQSAKGQDVAGSFTVNGTTEAATGTGQTLTGASGNANTAGLAVRVTLAAAGTGTVTLTQGIASQLDNVLNNMLDPSTGELANIDQNYQDEVSSLQTTINQKTQEMNNQHDQLVEQFSAMETAISQLQSTSNYLTSQMNAIAVMNGTSTTGSTSIKV